MEQIKQIAPPSAVFKRYISATRKHYLLLVLILIGTFGFQAAQLLRPIFFKDLLNLISSTNVPETVSSECLQIIYIIGFIQLLSWASIRIRGWSQIYLEIKVMQDLASSAYEYLLHHSTHFFSSNFSGTLTRRITKYSDAYEAIMDALFFSFLPFAIFVIGAGTVVFLQNHTLGYIFFGWTFVALIFQIKVTNIRQPLRDKKSEADSKMVGFLSDTISNQSTITLFSGEKSEYKSFLQYIKNWSKATTTSWIANENIWTVQSFLQILVNIGLLYATFYFWQKGQATVGDFILIQLYLLNVFDQIGGINRDLRRIYDSFANAGEMVAILDSKHDILDKKNASNLKIAKGEIEFKQVNFSFHSNRPILKNFSIRILQGQKVALVGPSGAGKSTITKLLLRLYDVNSGAIEIDQQNIQGVKQSSLRDSIGFVPQEPVLFHRSLLENIRYGKRDATDEEVIEAAKKAHCHEFISKLSEGYATLVGERGIKLSGGERQRVAVARAILKNAPILILDEATSSLDSESEQYIQESLKFLMQGKTVIVIAHRLSTIMNMDRILVIDKGTVEADGTHSELIQRDGVYQKLWNIQAGGFIPDDNTQDVEFELVQKL